MRRVPQVTVRIVASHYHVQPLLRLFHINSLYSLESTYAAVINSQARGFPYFDKDTEGPDFVGYQAEKEYKGTEKHNFDTGLERAELEGYQAEKQCKGTYTTVEGMPYQAHR